MTLPIDWLIGHGIVGRRDLPVPELVFLYAAVGVLVVSFIGLAILWPRPKLEDDTGWRRLFRLPGAAVIDALCGAIGVFLLGVTVWAGLAGEQTPQANWAPTFVYVIFWLGFAAASVLFGDVFKAFNPWRAIGRAVAGVAKLARGGGSLPEPLSYPERLGRWPAAAGIFAFAWMELAASDGDTPRNVAIAALVYSALTFVAMALYGIDRWIERGEAFSVYFNLYARIGVWERRGSEVGVRPPLSGLARLEPMPGTVALLAVMIGSVSFDGASEKSPWVDIAPDIGKFFADLGLSPQNGLMVTYTLGLLAAIGIVYGLYRLGVAGARTVGGGFDSGQLANAFVHSLVPIAFVYAAAHYMTLLIFQGQGAWFLASDPLGEGDDFFGTAGRAIDYGVIGANATWYWQVGFVLLGHVAGLILAHDRAVAMYRDPKKAASSQYWMLAVMVFFTSLALWLLSEYGS